MTRWRHRIAEWLIGPFVTLPERDGIWIVQRSVDGRITMTIEAATFRLKSGNTFSPRAFGSPEVLERWGQGHRWGRFVGTVKYR